MNWNVDMLAHFDKPISKATQGIRRYGLDKNTQSSGGYPIYYKPFAIKPEHQSRSMSLPAASEIREKQAEDIKRLQQMLNEKEDELARICATEKNPSAFEPINEHQADSYRSQGAQPSAYANNYAPNMPSQQSQYPSQSPMRTDDPYQLSAVTAAPPEPKTFYPYHTYAMPYQERNPTNSQPQAAPSSRLPPQQANKAEPYQLHHQAAPVENSPPLPPQQENQPGTQAYSPQPVASQKIHPHLTATYDQSQASWSPQPGINTPKAKRDLQKQNSLTQTYSSSFSSPQRQANFQPNGDKYRYEQLGPSPQQYTFLPTQPDQYAMPQSTNRTPTPQVPSAQQSPMPTHASQLRPIVASQSPRQQPASYNQNPQSPVKIDPPNVFRRAYDPQLRDTRPPMRYNTPDLMPSQKKNLFQNKQTTNDYTMPLQKQQTYQNSNSFTPSPIPTNHLYMYGPNASSDPKADVRYAKKQPKNIAYNPMLGSVQDTTSYNMSPESVDPSKAYGAPLPRQATQTNNKTFYPTNQKYYSPQNNKNWQYQSGPNIFQAPRENNQYQLHASQSQYSGIGGSKYGNGNYGL